MPAHSCPHPSSRPPCLETTLFILGRCGCFDGGSCTCASSSQRVSSRSTPARSPPSLQPSPGPNAVASPLAATPVLNQPSPVQILPAQPEPQLQLTQQPNHMALSGTTEVPNELDGWAQDANFNSWDMPTLHDTLLDDAAAAMDLDAMLMTDWTQDAQAPSWPLDSPPPPTESLGDPWPWDQHTEHWGRQDGNSFQDNHNS